MPKAAILTIGTELLLGKVVDTNGAYLGERLSSAGFDVTIRVSVGDHLREITRWVQDLLQQVELVITTGGLGPTKDDLTRQGVADALGVPLVFHESLMREIEGIFSSRGFRMTENNRRQAYLPEGATPISNPMGTAPAFLCRTDEGRVIVCLPGVPRELKYLLEKKVLSTLRRDFGLENYLKRTRVLKVCGLGESGVDAQIGDLLKTEGNPFVGVLASPGMIRILITAEGKDENQVTEKIEGIEREIRRRLGDLIFGVDDETLEGVTMERLLRGAATLDVVDTATGGEIGRRLLQAFDGNYRSGTHIELSGERGRHIELRVGSVSSGGEGKLPAYEVSIHSGEEGMKKTISLGGNRHDVERRLGIIAIDLLRKWLK